MSAKGMTMVTKTKRVAATPARSDKAAGPVPKTRRRAPARADEAAPAATAPSQPAEADAVEAVKPNLLRAGLKALGNVRDDVVQHQSRVFEAILGIDPAKGWSELVKRDGPVTKAAEEAFGLRKFEAVFDQRVASALERMGLPSIAQWQALTAEVAALKAELRSLKAATQRKR
jgi:hypothetical protein